MSPKTMSLENSIGMDGCSASEKLLRRIPYVPEDSFAFVWSRHSLLSLSHRFQRKIERKWQEDYMMYVCLDDAGLARNKYLEFISGLQVYGDAFLFKVKRGGLDKLERAEYVNMDEDFGRDSWSLANANILLRKLLDPDLQDGKSMYFDFKLTPKLYADPSYRTPYMKSLTSVDAVRLPYSPSATNPICLVDIPLVRPDTSAKTYEEIKTLPKRVPDLNSYKGEKSFDWARRRAIKVTHNSEEDEYVTYMCLDKDSRLPLNQSLKTWSKSSPPNFYGDAYIFRMDSGTGDAPVSAFAKYLHVGKDIVTDGGQLSDLGSYIMERAFRETRFPSKY